MTTTDATITSITSRRDRGFTIAFGDDNLTVYAPSDLPACPDWCRHIEMHGDHGYDSMPNTAPPWTFLRTHVSEHFGTGIFIYQDEFTCDGVITCGPVRVWAWLGNAKDPVLDLTASDAREAAVGLLVAADELQRITAAGH